MRKTAKKPRKTFKRFTEADWVEWLDTHQWMLRSSNNGVSKGGFKWKPVGQWTTCPDWSSEPACGNGLHGNSPAGHGYGFDYSRLELCETKGEQVVIASNKVKVASARIVATNGDIPSQAFERCGWRVFYPVDGETVTPKHGELYVVTEGVVTFESMSGGDAWANGGTLTIESMSGGYAWANGGTLTIESMTGGDAWANGGTLTIINDARKA